MPSSDVNLGGLAGTVLIDKIQADIDRVNMSPHQLELFYHVAKCKGVSRAARQMPYGIQQPSVSLQVNALERDLGVTLYERRPFKLTPAGEELFRFVEPFFSRIPEVRERLQGAARIRIGASPIVIRDYLQPVIEAVERQVRRINLTLRALNQPELIDAVERNELDVVISLIPDKLATGVRAKEIMELPLILLVPKKSRIKSAPELWATRRISEPLISLGPNELICQRFQHTLGRLGIAWLPRIEMDSLDLIEKYVELGYGFGLSIRLPEKKLSRGVRALELPDFPSVSLGILYRNEAAGSDRIRRIFLDEVARQASRFRRKPN